jgi:hypothetical protein
MFTETEFKRYIFDPEKLHVDLSKHQSRIRRIFFLLFLPTSPCVDCYVHLQYTAIAITEKARRVNVVSQRTLREGTYPLL